MAEKETEKAPPENLAAEAAGVAAAAVVEQQQHVEEHANSAIAAAQAETDAANAEAQRIAAAAINTELGAQIQNTRQENETWRTQFQERLNPELAKIPALETQVAELRTGIATLLGALNPVSPSPSTPPKSEAEEAPPAQQANPSESAGGPPGNHAPPQASVASRKGKRLL